MPSVQVKDNTSLDFSLRRFKRVCEKNGIITRARALEAFEKPTTVKKRAKISAVKRTKKAQKKLMESMHRDRNKY